MSKKKILFIEDEVELVELMQMRLEANNYQMIAAYDGQEGLEKVYSEKPDLILLDIIIPKIDGFTLCRRLKDDPKTKHIPIIIISASTGKDLPEKYRKAGAEDFIFKPFEATELLEKIADQLK